jgi:hypothetical protein
MREEAHQLTIVNDLAANFTPEYFLTRIGHCRSIIAQVVAEDHTSDQHVARVHILRYLDLQRSRAEHWAEEEADLMAIVVRSEIELWDWARFVAKGNEEAAKFLREVNIDIRELHERMEKAFEGPIQPLPEAITGSRISHPKREDSEEYNFKLCSKLIHPTSFSINHPEATIRNVGHREYLSVQSLLYAYLIINEFHTINWTS